jgi:hypothetical protein
MVVAVVELLLLLLLPVVAARDSVRSPVRCRLRLRRPYRARGWRTWHT